MELSLSEFMVASWRRSISSSGRARSSSIVSWWVRSKGCGLFSLSECWLILRGASTKGALSCAPCVCSQIVWCPYKDISAEPRSLGYSPKCVEGRFAELRHEGVLRRLMCNSSQRRRSPDRMLHQTLSKGWCGHGSGLLLGLIVRARGGPVEARSRCAATENRSSCPAQRSGGHHPGHSCPVASVSQREGLLALRFFAPAPLLPHVLLPGSAQSAHASPGARAARSAACLRPRTRLSFGLLSRDGHDPRSGHREGEGFSQGALLWAGFLREERLQDRVGLRLQGCFGGRPGGDNHHFRSGPCGLRREAHRGSSRSLRPLRSLPGRQRLHRTRVGAALDGAIRGAGGGHPQERLPPSVAEGRSALGLWQASDHRRVIGQLKDFFALERHRAKTLGGLLTRLAAKVAAYTCAQRINHSLGRPLRHLADLLV